MWWAALALAGPEAGIQRMLDAGQGDKAREKCRRLNAQTMSEPRPLREVCASAMWPVAVRTDTYAGWVKFRTEWAGTSREAAANDKAAGAKLAVIGEKSSESTYTAFLTEFGRTGHAAKARELQARAAMKSVTSKSEAIRVAAAYASHKGLERAMQPWFEHFVKVDVQGDSFDVRLEPALPLPGATLHSEWAGRFGSEVVPLAKAAERHLGDLGMPAALVRQYADAKKTPSYTPCSTNEMDLGVQVTYGSLSTFHVVERPCGGKDPVFLAEDGRRLVGLTMAAGVTYRFGDSSLEWVNDGLRTSIPMLGERSDDILLVGPVLGEQIGPLWMLHPLAGGMPWYVKEEPPPTARSLPNTLVSVPVPLDVQLVATNSGDTRLEKPGQPRWTRELPAGKVRVVSPWLAEMTGLTSEHKALKRSKVDPLPPGYSPDWRPIPEVEDRVRVRGALSQFGITLRRAWNVALQGKGAPEILFEGTFKGDAVKGVLDPRKNGTYRLFVFHSPKTGDPLVFSYQARTWVAFRGPAGVETLCWEPRGLVRRLSRR